jgi:hypothetical protein
MRTVFRLTRTQQKAVDEALSKSRTCSLCKRKQSGAPKYFALQPVSSKIRDPLIRECVATGKPERIMIMTAVGNCWCELSPVGEPKKAEMIYVVDDFVGDIE